MMKHRIVAVATAGVMMLTGTSGVLADAETNPTTNDAIGFCVSNHNRNHRAETYTIGEERRENRGAQAEINQDIREGTHENGLCTNAQEPSIPGE